MSFEARISKLAAALDEAGVDAFIGHHAITLGYLQGFAEDAHERFMAFAVSRTGDVRLIAPALSEAQARRAGVKDVRPWADGEDPLVLFEELAKDWNLKSGILAVDATLPARQLLKMQDALPAALFKDGEGLLSSLMRVKGDDELDLLRRAGQIADEAFDEVLPKLKPGLTERQVEKMLRDAMAERGGKPTFSIIAVGAGAAEPHHLNGDTPLTEGQVLLLDFGCELEGYQSDITRTVAIGKASDEAKALYDVVYRAHMAARAAIRPGVAPAEIDAAARNVITEAGHGPAFFHRTGHGIGMNGHEHPYITADNREPLQVGECFSIEPGVYYAGNIGIRIENIVACSADGHISMNADPAAEIIEIG